MRFMPERYTARLVPAVMNWRLSIGRVGKVGWRHEATVECPLQTIPKNVLDTPLPCAY